MLNVTVNNRFGLHQRIMLMIMLVLLQFYSIGSDFFPENITTTSMEMVDKEAPDVLLDFDDNASLRTVRQEQVQIRALEIDLIWEFIPWNYGNAPSFLYFITYTKHRISFGSVPI